MKRLTCSVIIPTRNRLSDLLACLTSIQQQTVHPDELIIIDASDIPLENQEAYKCLLQNFTGATRVYYEHTPNPGLPFQRNRAMRHASGDIFYFFDDDVILESRYLEHMQKIFAIKPAYVGGMGAVTNIPPQKKSLFWGMKKFFGLQRIYASGGFAWSGMPLHAYGTSTFKEVRVLGGCCMAFRQSVCQRNFFDEKLGRYAYMEDADFSWRVSREKKLFYNPHARLAHMVSQQARDPLVDIRAQYIKNYSYLFFKNIYRTRRIKILAYCWTIFGLFVEALLMRNGAYVRGYCRGLWEFLRKK
jgi:GT2 family glycosyltransferase